MNLNNLKSVFQRWEKAQNILEECIVSGKPEEVLLDAFEVFSKKRELCVKGLLFYQKEHCFSEEDLKILFNLLKKDEIFFKKIQQSRRDLQEEIHFLDKNQSFYKKFRSYWIETAGHQIDSSQ